jgi:hypothetical protein
MKDDGRYWLMLAVLGIVIVLLIVASWKLTP